MANILIVDDASFMRNSLRYLIDCSGHVVVGMAKDGKEALEMYKRLKPDLITLDILMKEMDGITTLKELLKINPSVKVVMVTAFGHDWKQKEASEIGAIGFIRKPFKQSEIIETIEKALGKNKIYV